MKTIGLIIFALCISLPVFAQQKLEKATFAAGCFWCTDEASKAKWEKDKPFRQPIVTPIGPAGEFWPAEDYHQDYYKKNPTRYRFYVTGCGRYDRLDQLWGALRRK